MTVLMKITKPTYDAKTETDPDNMIFSSEYGTLKYYASGSVVVTASGSDVESTVTHNLGYVPFYLVYYVNPVTGRCSMTPEAYEGLGDPEPYSYIEAYADTTKLYFTIQTNTLNASVTYYYKIFKNSTGL